MARNKRVGGERTNEDRAIAALEAVRVATDYSNDEEGVLPICVGDLIANIMHLCDREKIDFRRALHMAELNFEDELDAEANAELDRQATAMMDEAAGKDGAIDELVKRIEALEKLVADLGQIRFTALEHQLNACVGHLNERLNTVETKLSSLNADIGIVTSRLSIVQANMERIDRQRSKPPLIWAKPKRSPKKKAKRKS